MSHRLILRALVLGLRLPVCTNILLDIADEVDDILVIATLREIVHKFFR